MSHPLLSSSSVIRLGACLAACTALWACTAHPLQAPDPEPEAQTDLPFVVTPENKLDLVFMIDNSGSMKEEQAALARNFPLFMQALEARGKVDLHLAVISSDVGAGNIDSGNCHGTGDGGMFRTGSGCGLEPGAAFLTVDRQGNKNFSGDLQSTFACIADLGIKGCGFEHQLQSLRTALYRPEQAGFLRPDAHLGIVLITDEDDCSGETDATLYAENRPGQDPNLRCATAGHVCGGQEVPAALFNAPLASCQPYERGADAASRLQRLINVSEVVAQIKALKAGTDGGVTVSAIMGWDDGPGASYRVQAGSQGLDLGPICGTLAGGPWSMPAVRLKRFVDSFGAQGSWFSMCEPDLAPAIEKIGETIKPPVDGVCLPALARDTDRARPGLQPECNVAASFPGPAGAPPSTRIIPSCAAGAPPCWEIGDAASCPGRFLRVADPDRAAAGTVATASCATCIGPDDPRCAP
jgi:hypothetical protein